MEYTNWTEMRCLFVENTPFWSAVAGRHLDIMKLLASHIDVDKASEKSTTPLAEAARQGFDEGVEFILGLKGVSVNMNSLNQTWMARDIATPLDLALQGGHGTCVTILKHCGARTYDELRAAGIINLSSDSNMEDSLSDIYHSYI
jgi:hypothetical protein